MVSTIRKFQLSSDLFWGYQMEVDILELEDMKEVNILLKNDLLDFLKKYNLLELYDRAKKLELHNHLVESITPLEFLEKTPEDLITYLCDHKHN